MKKIFKNLKNLLIVLLIMITGVLLLKNYIRNKKKKEVKTEVITSVVTKYDTVKETITTYVPKFISKIKYVRDTVYINEPVDTLAILKDYFATYVYEDKQNLDSLNLTIVDSISQNKVFARTIAYDFIYPTKTITKEVYLNNREFYWGININGTPSQLNYVGGGLMYKTKKKQIYSLGAGFNEGLQPVISGGLYWKIGK